jgi:hypothetical protein
MRKWLVLGLLLAAGCGSESSGTEKPNLDGGAGDGAATNDAGSAFDAQGSSSTNDAPAEVGLATDALAREETTQPDALLTPDTSSMPDALLPVDAAPDRPDEAQPDAPAPTDANSTMPEAGLDADALVSTDATDAGAAKDAAQDAACTADAFIGCDDASTARFCNSSGVGTRTQNCFAAGCNAAFGRCNVCSPGSTSCGSGLVQHCDQFGMPAADEPCPSSCASAPVAHCAYLQPTYLPDLCNSPASTPTLDIATDTTIDVGTDVPCNGGGAAQSAGPSLCILRYGKITVQPTKTLKVIGSRGVLLVADEFLSIEGTLDVSADGTTSGPGGGTLITGGAALQNTGGGGAGFLVAGAAGGTMTMDGGGANGGASVNPIGMQSLIGGTRPGLSATGIQGGGGGGAAMLIACRGWVAVSGTIDAGGGGGAGGVDQVAGATLSLTAGGGGGSGGYVIMQALTTVNLSGSFFANGGGGGAGATNDATGASGSDGLRSIAAALGGTPVSGAGAGGSGGIVAVAPGVGAHGTAGTGSPGGGGGSPGRFQVYVPFGSAAVLAPVAASPALQPTLIVSTR